MMTETGSGIWEGTQLRVWGFETCELTSWLWTMSTDLPTLDLSPVEEENTMVIARDYLI